MARRIFSREFKVEAVRLVQERGVSIAQASRDLDLNDNVLRRWIREMSSDPSQAFPGRGQMKADELEVEKLRREVVRLRAERDILKKAAAYFAKEVK
jgi:transposase